MNRKFIIAAGVSALLTSVPALADVKAGVDAWTRGEYASAIKEWRGPALKGDADAQFNMGQAYKLGRGVPMDLGIAQDWYRKAAEQGHMQASDNYGLVLFQSNRKQEALPYLQASADRGEPRAQYVMGTAHFNGDLVKKDWVRAYALMTRASSAGLPQASQSLSQMDGYIPLNQRQEGIALAGRLEQKARAARLAMANGSASPIGRKPVKPVATRPTVKPTPLPPSTFATPRPAAVKPSTPPVAVATAAAKPLPAPTKDGSWRIQLGAFGDQARAKSQWNTLESRVSGLEALQPYLVKAGAVTRLQAGPFGNRAQASATCDKVKASGQGCFPVKK